MLLAFLIEVVEIKKQLKYLYKEYLGCGVFMYVDYLSIRLVMIILSVLA